MIVYTLWREKNLKLNVNWKYNMILGIINAAVPIGLAAFAATRLPTGFANILFAPTPLFATIIAAIWIKEPFTRVQLMGCLLGIVGVTILVGWRSFEIDFRVITGIAAALGSSFLYALSSSFIKKYFKGVSATQMTNGQLISAAIFLFPFALGDLPAQMPSFQSLLIVGIFGLVSTALGFVLFFWLMSHVGAARTQNVALLIPCFGVFWGWLFLGEPITPNIIIGLIVVLLSVAMVGGMLLKKPISDNTP